MSELEDFIPTKGSVCNEQAVKNYKVSTFESYKPKEGKVSEAKIVSKTGVPRSEINMNKAKHEIIKFGMSGFDPTKKEEAKIQLAIKLGRSIYITFCCNSMLIINMIFRRKTSKKQVQELQRTFTREEVGKRENKE